MELTEFLQWLLTGGGAGIIAYLMMEEIPWFASFSPRAKRRMALALAGLLGIAAYLVGIGIGAYPLPATTTEWIARLFAVATTAFGLSQIVHGEARLSNQR